ncbi:zinc finger protein 48-like [Anopheles bellator]|uniref:zinc finger protein 48-like n=1 Tax=Anopheles bellator TaxID=139047 RepID=UPI002648F0DA|nr:zinc finger protein 48-like [Anopheles bellator]
MSSARLPPPAYYYLQASKNEDGEDDEDLYDSNGTLITSDYLNDVVAQSMSNLYRVLYDSKDNPLYKCNECDTILRNTGHLVGHIAVHTGENPYVCHLCQRPFSNSTRLKLHLKVHCIMKPQPGLTVTRVSRLSPHGPPTATTSIPNLEISVKNDDSTAKWRCIECGDNFPKIKLYQHMKQHLMEKNIFVEKTHSCVRCGVTFDKTQALQRHSDECTGEVSEITKGRHYINSEVELVPLRKPDSDSDVNPIEANPILSGLLMRERSELPAAGMMASSDHEEQRPMSESWRSPEGLPGDATPDAGFVISSVATVDEKFLESLAQMELQARTPEPDEVPETETEPEKLLSSSDDNIPTCGICGKAFNEPFGLRQHMRIKHANTKPYKCPECKKSFSQERYMLIHLRIHISARPFICIVCYKTFTRAAGLHGHMASHAHDTIQCIECSQVTFSVQNYARHIDSCHPNFCHRLDQIKLDKPEHERFRFLRQLLAQSLVAIADSQAPPDTGASGQT